MFSGGLKKILASSFIMKMPTAMELFDLQYIFTSWGEFLYQGE